MNVVVTAVISLLLTSVFGSLSGMPHPILADKSYSSPSTGLLAQSGDTGQVGDSQSTEASEEAEPSTSLLYRIIPDHGFHPLVNHFPIALFLFGVVMDAFGAIKNNQTIRRAGFWNMAAGSLSTLVVIPTGLIAFYGSDYTWHGLVVVHFALAITASALMAVTVLWRRNHPYTSKAYFMLLAVAALVLAAAGHFGGQLIYGV